MRIFGSTLTFWVAGLIFITGCTKKEESTRSESNAEIAKLLKPAEKTVPDASPTAPGICPGGMAAAGAHPKFSMPVDGGGKLIVCGGDRKDEFESPKLQMTEFDVVHVDAAGKTSESLLAARALDNYYVYESGGKLVLDELFYYRGGWREGFRSTVSCSAGKCTRSQPVCVLDRKSLARGEVTRSEVKAIREKVKSARDRGENYSFDEMEIWPVFDGVLGGDADAKRFFESIPTLPRSLDGASAEAYHEAQAQLKRFAKCP